MKTVIPSLVSRFIGLCCGLDKNRPKTPEQCSLYVNDYSVASIIENDQDQSEDIDNTKKSD
jgi:hypothetical protein